MVEEDDECERRMLSRVRVQVRHTYKHATRAGTPHVQVVKRSTAEMTLMIVTPRHNDWNQELWISAHYVCILLLIRYHCFNDFASATPLKSVISALRMWAAIVLSMCRRYPTFIC